MRDQFNASRQPLRNRSDPLSAGYTPELAAQLIYLNRTGFNGLFRLNARGVFNVPKGSYKNPTICDGDGLRRTASALRRSSVRVVEADFEVTLDAPEPRDFVYCDPPYAPVSETSDFTAWGYPFNRSRPDPQLSRADSRVGAPGSVGVSSGRRGRRQGPRAPVCDQVVVADWSMGHGQLKHSKEHQPATARAASVEAKHELVQVSG